MSNNALANIRQGNSSIVSIASKSGAETLRPLNFKEWKESHPNVLGNAARRLAYAAYRPTPAKA